MTPGVGVLFNPALSDFVRTHRQALDYLAVIPDWTWTDHGPGTRPRFEDLAAPSRALDDAASSLPIVMHSTGMSICSAGIFDEGYVNHLAGWRARYRCAWASDHLSFTRFGQGHEANAAVALPLPYDREMLELVVPRARIARERVGCTFLLENTVSYLRPDEEFTEAEFLNRLARESGCGILLDLHNVYTTAHNHGVAAKEFLGALDPDIVMEVHVPGGDAMMGFQTDSRTGPVVEAVWDLLDDIAPRLSALRGVTFEFHESSWPLLHDDGLLEQIEWARALLQRAMRAEA